MSARLLTTSLVLLALSSPGMTQTSAPGTATIQRFDGAGIAKWAECSWKRQPLSASNWLKSMNGGLVTANPSRNPMAQPKAVLALRLDAACGNMLAGRDRNSISYGVERAKAAALEASRPSSLPASEAKSKALVCEMWSQGTLMVTVLSSEGKKPKSPNGAQVRCFKTLEDGSLTNA